MYMYCNNRNMKRMDQLDLWIDDTNTAEDIYVPLQEPRLDIQSPLHRIVKVYVFMAVRFWHECFVFICS